jgi:hypothetical protein
MVANLHPIMNVPGGSLAPSGANVGGFTMTDADLLQLSHLLARFADWQASQYSADIVRIVKKWVDSFLT